jgi:protein pelota
MQVIADNSKTGELVITIDTLDDLWVLYNIIRPGDRARARTTRRVVLKEGDSGERKPMTLTIKVEKVEFHEFINSLRLLGSILEGPDDFVGIGEHHTLSIEPGTKLSIFKDQWLRSDIERIRRNLERKDQLLTMAIAMETGLANIALLSNYSLTPVTEIKENIPGKRYDKQLHKESIDNFYRQIHDIILDHLKRYKIGMIILCGPGFNKETFAEELRENIKNLPNPPQIKLLSASSGEISSIHEILQNGTFASLNTELKIAQDGSFMAEFIQRLGKGEQTLAYGIDEVELSAQMGAIETLLICDVLIRAGDIKERQRFDAILNETEKNRGKVHILSTASPAGDQLLNYGKIAALLRFRVKKE